MKIGLIATLLTIGAAIPALADDTLMVGVTFYPPTGNRTYNGEWPYAGSAGCSWDIPLGTVLEFADGTTVRCNDRGNSPHPAPYVDIYCAGSYAACQASIPGKGDWQTRQPARVVSYGDGT